MSAIIRVKRPAQEGEVWPAVGGASHSCELELVFSENQQRRPNPRVLAAGWRGGCHYGVISGLRAEDSGHSDNNGPESIVIVLRGSDSA